MVDLFTARHHGVCPTCEGYGGNSDVECKNPDCFGSCPNCWCPACHDGHEFVGPMPEGYDEGPFGSWQAFEQLHPEEAARA